MQNLSANESGKSGKAWPGTGEVPGEAPSGIRTSVSLATPDPALLQALSPRNAGVPPEPLLPGSAGGAPSPFRRVQNPENSLLKLPLASLLSGQTGGDLGFEPSVVPGTVEAGIPLETVMSQLATGRVELTLPDLINGLEERFRPAFARTRPGIRFVVPLAELLPRLPAGAIPADHAVTPEAPAFHTPFSTEAALDRPPVTAPAGLPALTPFPLSPPARPAPLATLPPLGGHDDLGRPYSAGSLRAEPPAAASAPVPKPATKTLPAAPAVEFAFSGEEPPAALTLRALFKTAVTPGPEEIARRCAALPGLRDCVLMVPGHPPHASADAAGSREFYTQAPRAHESLRGLAQCMGFPESGSFTLRTGSTLQTYFIERRICLAVLHGGEEFEPGVRETLLLTARTLADLPG